MKNISNIATRLRILSGCILYAFAVTHLLNHATGIIHLAAMEQGRMLFVEFWRHPLISPILLFALIIHVVIALRSFLLLSSLKHLTLSQWTQYVSEFFIPIILLQHIIFTGVMNRVFDIEDSYSAYLLTIWGSNAARLMLSVMLTAIMIHGSIGIFSYLKLRMWFQRFRQDFVLVSILLPLFAVFGILSAGRELSFRTQLRPGWSEQIMTQATPQQIDRLAAFNLIDCCTSVQWGFHPVCPGALFTLGILTIQKTF